MHLEWGEKENVFFFFFFIFSQPIDDSECAIDALCDMQNEIWVNKTHHFGCFYFNAIENSVMSHCVMMQWKNSEQWTRHTRMDRFVSIDFMTIFSNLCTHSTLCGVSSVYNVRYVLFLGVLDFSVLFTPFYIIFLCLVFLFAWSSISWFAYTVSAHCSEKKKKNVISAVHLFAPLDLSLVPLNIYRQFLLR